MMEETCIAFAYINNGVIQMGYTYTEGPDKSFYQLKFGPKWDPCLLKYANMHETIRAWEVRKFSSLL